MAPTTDRAIPWLRRLARPAEAATALNAVLQTADCAYGIGEGPWTVREACVLRGHKGSRWTLRYAVESRAGLPSALYAKVYARDRRDIADVLAALRRSGLGRGRPMQAIAPLGYASGPRLLLLEEAPGETVRAVLRRGDGAVGERVARWLASFHAAAPVPTTYRLHDPLEKARRWAQTLETKAPALRRSARRLLDGLAAAQPDWPPPRPCMVHGDFGASHVFLAEETVTVIDWDGWRVGDWGEDAGRFMASLHAFAARDPSRTATVARERDRFARIYRAAVPAARDGLSFYEALACLRKAARLSSSGSSNRLRRTQDLLASGERALGSR